MSEQAPLPEKKSLVQRVTQMFTKGSTDHAQPAAPIESKPVESDEKREERLAAYRKLCEEEAKNQAPEDAAKPKKIKYRAADMNSGNHRKVD